VRKEGKSAKEESSGREGDEQEGGDVRVLALDMDLTTRGGVL
jgi:hypothetical protein